MIVVGKDCTCKCPRRTLLASDRITRKYRRAHERKLRLIEYRKLRDVIPTLTRRHDVTKIDVVQAAIDYIDELHLALARRFNLFPGQGQDQEAMNSNEQLMEVIQQTIVQSHLSNPQSQCIRQHPLSSQGQFVHQHRLDVVSTYN